MLRIRLGKSDLELLDSLCELYKKSRSEVMRALLRRAIHLADPLDNLFSPLNYDEEALQFSEEIIPIEDMNDEINQK